MAQGRKSGRREDFHEWRKGVKDHWYQVRLLKKVWGDVMEPGHSRTLQSMASENGSGPKLAPATKTIDAARKELRDRALAIREKVYAEKPKEFARRIRRL
jgi:hypothetical protein